ncbi:MAG: LamG domain-containing protein [Sedimentisphaerales bacterium]
MCRKSIYLISFFLAFGMVLTSAAQAGPVGLWRFEDGTGTIANDSSGNGRHGTLLGIPEWVSGPDGLGGALAFNPDRCTGVDCGVFDPTNGTGQFTVALWAFWDGTGTFQHFLTKSNAWGADTMMFQFELWGAHTSDTYTDRIGVSYAPAGSVPFSIMPKNEWVHLTLTFDGTNATLYLNGVDEEGPKPFSIGPNIDAMVEIGYTSTRPSGIDRTFQGTLDEVSIYGRSLSGQEIQTVMAGGVIQSGTASLPKPGNQAVEVSQDAVLSWMAGDFAVTHDVYLGTVFDDVNDASRDNDPNSVLVSQNQEATTYEPPDLLEFGQSYYWRIDEFNDLDPNSPWKGDVWSFMVINYFTVDDFEDYNDYPPDDIFSTWKDGYDIDENGALIGYDAPDIDAGEHFVETSIVHEGKQAMPYFYNNIGATTYSEAQYAFSPGQDWTREGVEILSIWFKGHPAYVGSFVEAPADTYTMTGSGIDIWDTADEFHFAFKELTGAGTIIAKVESLQNTHAFAKAGVMIRDTLDADSRYTGVFITPENGVRFQYRNTPGGVTDRQFVEGITAPYWVKLERTSGGLVRAYYSVDGTTWERFNLIQVTMNTPMYIGLAMTSHDAELAGEAVFSNVSFPGTSIDEQWTDQDVGMLSNEPEPMYVTVVDGSGTAATVYYDDPNASLIRDWTQWNIPLTNFSDQGVVLTDVSKLAIGFGIADDPQSSSSGLVYFDNIRLYLPRPKLEPEPEP